MPRNLPGKIIREAPPGPEMTEAEFRAAMSQLADDAARWRCLRRNWSNVLEVDAPLPLGSDLQALVDQMRKQGQ